MIGRADELLVHQTEKPLAQVVSDHPEWQDRFYFNIHDRGGKFAVITGLGAFPNRKAGPHGMVQAYMFVIHNGRHYAYLNVRPINADREEMRAGSLSFAISIYPFAIIVASTPSTRKSPSTARSPLPSCRHWQKRQ